MKSKTLIFFSLSTLILFSCNQRKQKQPLIGKLLAGDIKEYSLPNGASLRGVSIYNDNTIWISGSKGTFARSIDGGLTWINGKINSDTLLDFRDVHAFSTESAIAISAGSPARIYKTTDGGSTWQLKYENTDSLVFFNSFDFCDAQRGIACGDPMRGTFLFLSTQNAGETWDTVDVKAVPIPLNPEGGFAASGTSVIYAPNGLILYGTGGSKARIFRSADFGKSWQAIETPIVAGESSIGIYSVGQIDGKSFVIAGGCWQKSEETSENVAFSYDRGKTWQLSESLHPGFISCIKYLPESKLLITCGTSGVNYSTDMGKTWVKTPLQGYNALGFSTNEKLIVLVGAKGRIAVVSNN